MASTRVVQKAMLARAYWSTYRIVPARNRAGTESKSWNAEAGGVGFRIRNSAIHTGQIMTLVTSLKLMLSAMSEWMGWRGFSSRGDRLPSRTRHANSNASHDMVRWPN